MTIYQIDADAAKTGDEIRAVDDAIQAGVLVPGTVAGPSVFVISGDFTDIQDMWTALHDRDRLVKVERVGEETP